MSPGRNTRWPLAVVVALVLAWATEAPAAWRLWPTPFESSERVDQAQTGGAGEFAVTAKRGVGQTWVAARSPLVRIDVQVKNRSDPRPGRVRIWRWRGDVAATRSETPLFEDVVDLSGRPKWQIRSFFPRLDVERGATYYVELTATGRTPYLLMAEPAHDPYPKGRLILGDRPGPAGADLWFRSFATGPSTRAAVPAPRLDLPGRASWHALASGQAVTGPAGYLERIRSQAARVRALATAGCGGRSHHLAAYDAFLYRASCASGTCDEERARDAARALGRANAWRFCVDAGKACDPPCSPDPAIGADWLVNPALAWTWIRESPSVDATDRARVRELLTDSARRFWPRREAGSFNRAMIGALGLRLVANLFPDASGSADWRRYADGVWSYFRQYLDSQEDASGYAANVWLPSVLAYARISGTDQALWKEPDFRRLVERYADTLTPLGVLPNYGDGSGWAHDQSGLIFLFESAGAHWHSPYYRWLAERLFRYQTLQPRASQRQSDVLSGHLVWLALAYLSADESIAPAPPEPRRELAIAKVAANAAEASLEGAAVGQTFTAAPEGGRLVRLDLHVHGASGGEPARVSLFAWSGTPDATVTGSALYAEDFALPPPTASSTSTFLPFVPLEPGRQYYLEIRAQGGVSSAACAEDHGDCLPVGQAFVEGRSIAERDLAFAAYRLSEGGSLVTTRRVARLRTPDRWGRPKQYYDLGLDRVGDKLILRSGDEPDDLHAVFNLLSAYGHGQIEQGALVSLVDGGSVLLTDGPYPYARYGAEVQDESAPLARRYWGGHHAEAASEAAVTSFADARNATLATIQWSDPHGWDVGIERRLVFVKNRMLWVRDRFRFRSPMQASVGPVWHAARVAAAADPRAYLLYDPGLFGNVWRYRNPERYVSLYQLSRKGTTGGAFLEPTYLPPARCAREKDADVLSPGCRSTPPWVLYQQWTGRASAGDERGFDTLLVPSGSSPSSQPIVKVLRRGPGGALAVRVDLGPERWLLVDNPTRKPIETADLSSDARTLVGRVRQGRLDYLLTDQASYVEAGGESLRWPVVTSVEHGGSLEPERLVIE